MTDEDGRPYQLVSELIEHMDSGSMVTKFIVIAEGLDSDGNRACYTSISDGLKLWDSLGLLSYAAGVENARILRLGMDE